MGFWGQNSIRAQVFSRWSRLFRARADVQRRECLRHGLDRLHGRMEDVLAGTHELSFCIGIEAVQPDAPERTALFNQGYITSQHDRLIRK
jgi:hypothetical protein